MIPDWTKARSRLGIAVRRGDDPGQIRALRAEVRAARTADFLRQQLAADPPIPPAHRAELAALLLPGGGAGA